MTYARKLKDAIKPYIPSRLYARLRYPSEYKLLQGIDLRETDRKSVLFFTVHKCASSAMPRIFGFLNRKYLHMTMVNLEAFIFNYSSKGLYNEISDNQKKLFRRSGFLYVPLRKFIAIEDIASYARVLMLRDPRDVLVSQYYSLAFSHTIPIDRQRRIAFLNRRAFLSQMDINEFAVSKVREYRDKYLEYWTSLNQMPGTSRLDYESMVLDTDAWIKKLLDALEIEGTRSDSETIKRIARLGTQSRENKYSHIRKALPGDYKNKLSPGTISILNRELEPVSMFFFE